jgi:hypothetical protein
MSRDPISALPSRLPSEQAGDDGASAVATTLAPAQAKFAHELRGILGDLAEAEVSPENLSLLRGLDL